MNDADVIINNAKQAAQFVSPSYSKPINKLISYTQELERLHLQLLKEYLQTIGAEAVEVKLSA